MIKLAFIGFGRMGITHYSILNSHPQVQVKAVCDRSATMLSIVKKYLKVETYTDHREMLNNEELDAVVISTPTDSHAALIQEAIDRNLHIFAEKPFALTATEGRDCLQKLEGKDLVNQIGYVNRFNEVFVEVRNLLESGVIGELTHYRSEMYGGTVLKDSGNSWRGKGAKGGGCMYEFGSHCIDLALYLFGMPNQVSGSVLQSIYSSEVDDRVSSRFLHEGGYVGDILVNWSDQTFRKPTNIVTAFGTEGKIVADKHAYKIYLRDAKPELGYRERWNTRYITDFAKSVRFYVRGNEFTHQLDHFVDCIEQGGENLSSFQEAWQTDKLIEEIRTDAQGGARENGTGHTLVAPPGKKKKWKWLKGS